ncbi:MAG TPA: serine/threonine-protein kinase [Vicinamibacterales bacterium]|nr:serine/threonine-protein kinase [Vicinamibacterales bacterium]
MGVSPHVVAPRLTPPAASSGSGKSVRLPDDVVREQVTRVSLFTAVSAFMWGFGMLMDGLVFPATMGKAAPRVELAVEGIAVVTTLTILIVLRYAPISSGKKVDCGLWLTLLNCFGTTAIETWLTGLDMNRMGGPSWTATVILASAMIMPNSPRKTLITSLGAAAMGPLGVWVAHLRGFNVPDVLHTLLMFIPNFLWAGIAALPAAMFQRMGKRINEARAIGSYELIEQLGAGGMGTVWRARHRFLARDAAVKLVRPEALGDTDSSAQSQRRRFEREAQATAQLRSQHSIRLFDFGTADEGSFYYVMELLEGRDLESVVKDFGPLAPERVTFLLKQICHSLAEAHARGMVHRDIKPANIFLCRMGLEFDFVKVLDFGLVQTRKADASTAVTETLTTAHQLMGTPAYMAPEVILGKEDVDRRADVYAIGCVAFYLLTGTRVFEGGNHMQALIDHVHTEPVTPSTRVGKPLPKALDRLIIDCLRKKPDDRPRDAADVLDRVSEVDLPEAWSNSHARVWWTARLPELSGPLVPN